MIRDFCKLIAIYFSFIAYTLAGTLSPYVNNHTPAFATLVIKNGKTVFKDTEGCSVLENNVCITKATLDTPFAIASVTKHFTAAGILMLQEEGKLSLDDSIIKYIPNLPARFKNIKIKHLIFQISGIPDYQDSMDHDYYVKQGKIITFNEEIEFIKKAPLQPYSKKYAYSNSNYALLTKIIENISGQAYAEFMQQRIFDKFKMKDAFVMSASKQDKNYPGSYTSWPLFTPTHWMEEIVLSGDGGIFMSINDFEKWINAIQHQTIFRKRHTMKQFLSIGKYDNGNDVIMSGQDKYGFGLGYGKVNKNGKTYLSIKHNGEMPGSASSFSDLYNKKENIWVIYLNNADSYPDRLDILDQLNIKY